MSRLARRVAVVAGRRRAAATPVLPFLLVSPGQWPPQDEAAYWAAEAAGDQEAMDELVERHTGERPAPAGVNRLVVVVREVPSPAR